MPKRRSPQRPAPRAIGRGPLDVPRSSPGAAGTGGGVSDSDPRLSDDRVAAGIRTATTIVLTGAAAAPTAGQVLTATSDEAAEWQDPSSSSGVTKGTTEIDFGLFPGSSDASVTVTGQTGILSGSVVQAWLQPKDTSDHTADEHWVEKIAVSAGNVVAGTGFTIYAKNTSQLNEPLGDEGVGFISTKAATQTFGRSFGFKGGKGTRIYGVWHVAWQWS